MRNNASYTPSDNSLTGFASNVTGASWVIAVAGPADGLGHLVTIRNDTANDHSGKTAALVGTDVDGKVLTETMALPAGSATTTSTKYFATLTSITPSATIGADTMDIGWSDVSVTKTYPVNDRQNTFDMSVAVVVTGTIQYDVEFTFDDPFSASQSAVWFTNTAYDDNTANAYFEIKFVIRAVRIKIDSLTSGATIRVVYLQGNP